MVFHPPIFLQNLLDRLYSTYYIKTIKGTAIPNNRSGKMINPIVIEKMVETIKARETMEYIFLETDDGDEYWFMMTVSKDGKKAKVGLYDFPHPEADCYAEEVIVIDKVDIEAVVKNMLEDFVKYTCLEVL